MRNSTTQSILLVVAVVLLSAGTYFAYSGNVSGAYPTFGAAIFCLIFYFLPYFSEFEGFGVKAKLQTQKMDEYDRSGDVLRGFWKPDGENVDALNEQRMREWMKKNNLEEISIITFLRGNLLAEARREAITTLRL